MQKQIYITGLLFFCFSAGMLAQEADTTQDKKNELKFSGQLSAWAHVNANNPYPFYIGGRYIPKLNYKIPLKKTRLIDFEVSANIYGYAGIHFFDSATVDGNISPYRVWGRYSTKQFEFRAGLQKIDFGTAKILRALRWFDEIDPRDPLQLTDGVWGGLVRYYFLNNTNIWFWGLYGTDQPKGLELIGSNSSFPEFGGRLQTPIPGGEAGIAYHHRVADSQNLNEAVPSYNEIPENRIGLDAKWDLLVGLWFEAAWVTKNKEMAEFTNQEIFTLGTDYTFGIGGGLNVTLEHMLLALDENPFQFSRALILVVGRSASITNLRKVKVAYLVAIAIGAVRFGSRLITC